MSSHGKTISIWFFIGVLMLIYGVLILGADLFTTTSEQVVLRELRAGLWWGILLIIVGAVYTVKFRPGKT